MPLIKLQTVTPVPEEKQQALLASASRIVAKATGKPETYVMAILEPAAAATMAGQAAPVAFVDVRGIGGVNATVNTAISNGVCIATGTIRARWAICSERASSWLRATSSMHAWISYWNISGLFSIT